MLGSGENPGMMGFSKTVPRSDEDVAGIGTVNGTTGRNSEANMDAHESAATTRSSLESMDGCDRTKHVRGKGMAAVQTAPRRWCHCRIPKATCERSMPGSPGERTAAVEHLATAGSVTLPAEGEVPLTKPVPYNPRDTKRGIRSRRKHNRQAHSQRDDQPAPPRRRAMTSLPPPRGTVDTCNGGQTWGTTTCDQVSTGISTIWPKTYRDVSTSGSGGG